MKHRFSTLLFAFLFLVSLPNQSEARWGQIGHYVTGYVAESYLDDDVKAKVAAVLGDITLPRACVWMDDIRSDSAFDYTRTWHWATIEDGKTYEGTEQEPTGDVISASEEMIASLKSGTLSPEEESINLKLLIHMIGDMHMPLHVGNGTDRGGNQVRVQWMGDNSNLHRVWDSDIINSLQMSYMELAREVDFMDAETVTMWQSGTVRDWGGESVSYRDAVYDLPEDMRLGYEYRYYKKDIIFKRLAQAGVRIAGVLNEIYGS